MRQKALARGRMSVVAQRDGSVPHLFPISKRYASGDLVGNKYRLVRQVGAGAMGTVWIAHNDLLDVDVALKLLRPIESDRVDPDRLYNRLLQEARAAARLGHPGIVRVFDFGQTEDGSPYIVMELLEGESLAAFMAREPRLEPEEAVRLLLPVMEALATAHGRGIVHRDVKPENIFLARDEYGRLQPKMVDFGVARFAEGGRSLTRSGALVGTPDYMAPEQAKGVSDPDHRVDIWAICIVLFELIAGKRPFGTSSTNYLAVLRAIVNEPPLSLLELGRGDAALWVIIERGLRKDRSQRWETMRVLGEALALWLYERGVREDALGASLKTTWLQSGIDGVKIETASMGPPPDPKALPPVVSPAPLLPTHIESFVPMTPLSVDDLDQNGGTDRSAEESPRLGELASLLEPGEDSGPRPRLAFDSPDRAEDVPSAALAGEREPGARSGALARRRLRAVVAALAAFACAGGFSYGVVRYVVPAVAPVLAQASAVMPAGASAASRRLSAAPDGLVVRLSPDRGSLGASHEDLRRDQANEGDDELTEDDRAAASRPTARRTWRRTRGRKQGAPRGAEALPAPSQYDFGF